jgi:hypothetical protein
MKCKMSVTLFFVAAALALLAAFGATVHADI